MYLLDNNYNIARIYRRLLIELLISDDLCLGERILYELTEMVPDIMDESLVILNQMNFYCTNTFNIEELNRELFIFRGEQECQATIGFCSCTKYINSVLIDEMSITCEHELAIVIIYYLSKVYRKRQIGIDRCFRPRNLSFMRKIGLQEYTTLLEHACDIDN